MIVKGIDTNQYRGSPSNFALARNVGYAYAYLRATMGALEEDDDTLFLQDRATCLSIGLPYGAYHVFTPWHSPIDQARHFYAVTGKGQLPPWLDIEIGGIELQAVEQYLQEYERLVKRYDTLLYCNANDWSEYAAKDPIRAQRLANRYRLAVASYRKINLGPVLPQHWSGYTFWQHSMEGNVPGVNPPTDLSLFNGNIEELYAMTTDTNIYQITTLATNPGDEKIRRILAEQITPIDGVTVTALKPVDLVKPPSPPSPPTGPLANGRVITPVAIRNRQGQPAKDGNGRSALPIGQVIDIWERSSIALPNNGGSSERYYFDIAKILNVWIGGVVLIGAAGIGGGDNLNLPKLRWPIDTRRVNQMFGDNPANYKPFNLPGHEGTDMEAVAGNSIFATASGLVTDVIIPTEQDWRKEGGHPYGNHVRILHTFGNRYYKTVYAHLSSVLVVVGQDIRTGDLLGLAGSTGNSSGPHLHFGIYEVDKQRVRVDTKDGYNGYFNPLPYLYFPS